MIPLKLLSRYCGEMPEKQQQKAVRRKKKLRNFYIFALCLRGREVALIFRVLHAAASLTSVWTRPISPKSQQRCCASFPVAAGSAELLCRVRQRAVRMELRSRWLSGRIHRRTSIFVLAMLVEDAAVLPAQAAPV